MLDDLAAAAGCARSEVLRAALVLAAEADLGKLRALVASIPSAASRRERNRAMAAARAAGQTWAVIAERFGVSDSGARYGVLAHRAEAAGDAGDAPRLRVVGGRRG